MVERPPAWYRREIRLGDVGPDVVVVRRKLGLLPAGAFDEVCEELVRGLARKRRVETRGEVNDGVAAALGPQATAGLVPAWFTRPLQLWFEGDDVQTVRELLGVKPARGMRAENRYTPEVEEAVRRWQSEHEFPLTGQVDEAMARAIGDVD
jgi:peptidoglycan hydrolase-like protein with peptidoglycan-binding domain